jgi:hypothetical protein
VMDGRTFGSFFCDGVGVGGDRGVYIIIIISMCQARLPRRQNKSAPKEPPPRENL